MNAQRIIYNLVISKYRETEESHYKALIHGPKFAWVKETQQINGKSEREEKILCICTFQL